MNKERWMQTITEAQERTLDAYIPRDLDTPFTSNKIISVVGSRRCGNSRYAISIYGWIATVGIFILMAVSPSRDSVLYIAAQC